MENKKIFIVGAGTMGRGIAQVASTAGCKVYMSDIDIDYVKQGIDMIKKGLDKQVQKGKMSEERVAEILDGITPVENFQECSQADFIVEAVLEDIKLKRNIFKEIDEVASPSAILASNTTACSITDIASATKLPHRVVGMHFFNPAIIMKLVEIMPGIFTDEETVEKTKYLALSWGKDPVVTKKEGPAGVTSRVLAGLLNEAVWVLHEGIATVDNIDKAVKLGCNHKMGPFELIDLIGIDVHLAKTKTLFEITGDLRYRPCYLLDQMIKAGLLGKKVGKGFYDYTKETKTPIDFFKR